MANTNAAYGFRPVRNKNNTEAPSTNCYAPQGYSIASGYASTIALGDPVGRTGTASADGRPGIQLVSTPGTIVGVFAGVEYTNSSGERIFSDRWPASTAATDIIAHVYDDERTIFSVQASASLAVTDIGNKADYVHAASVNGVSRVQLDASTIGTGDALAILGLDNSVSENNFGEAYGKFLVAIREHEFHSTITAV